MLTLGFLLSTGAIFLVGSCSISFPDFSSTGQGNDDDVLQDVPGANLLRTKVKTDGYYF